MCACLPVCHALAQKRFVKKTLAYRAAIPVKHEIVASQACEIFKMRLLGQQNV